MIYNQFQHPAFRPTWLCGWYLAGFEALDIEFMGSPEMLFAFNDDGTTPECTPGIPRPIDEIGAGQSAHIPRQCSGNDFDDRVVIVG